MTWGKLRTSLCFGFSTCRIKKSESEVTQSCLTLCDPATLWTVARQAPLSMGFSTKNTGVGCRFLLQGIFLTQGLNPGIPHCRQAL